MTQPALAEMEPHPHPNPGLVRPRFGRNRPLGGDRRNGGRQGPLECGEECVALGLDHDTAGAFDRAAKELIVPGDDARPGREPAACSRRVDPSMSVNRNATFGPTGTGIAQLYCLAVRAIIAIGANAAGRRESG